MSFNRTSLIICALSLLPVLACEREKDLPKEPIITSLKFDDATESLLIEFSDGDGNFGIDSDDPDFPEFLDEDSTERNPYYENLWVDYYELRNGEWVFVPPLGTWNFRVPDLTPTGQSKQLEVLITYDMSAELPLPNAQSDTIKFRVILVDRSLNESQPQETGRIVLNN